MYDYERGRAMDMPPDFRARLIEVDGDPGSAPDSDSDSDPDSDPD